MDKTKTLWKDLIDETKTKLAKYPIAIERIYDKDTSLRIAYHWTDQNDYDETVDKEIENIIMEAEAKSEDLVLYEENKDKASQKEMFTFGHDKTFFGLTVHAYGIKESDIKKLPFYAFWKASSVGSTCALFNGETYIYKHDWENFCRRFIQSGTHRYI